MNSKDPPDLTETEAIDMAIQRAREEAEFLKRDQEDEAWDKWCDEYNSHYGNYDDGTRDLPNLR